MARWLAMGLCGLCLVTVARARADDAAGHALEKGRPPNAPTVPPNKGEDGSAAATPVEAPGHAGGISLREALSMMKGRSLELKAARLDIDAARSDVIAAGILANPTLSINGSFFVAGEPTGAKQSLNFIVDDVIPVAGQVGLRKNVAQRYEKAAEADFAQATWSLALDVREAYLNVQLVQARLELLHAARNDLDRVESIVGRRATEGSNPPYDLVRVRVERSDLTAQAADAEAALVEARAALAAAIGPGVAPASLVAKDDLPAVGDPPKGIGELAQKAVESRPDVLAARVRVDAATAHIGQVKREYVPSPDLAVGVSPWFNVPTTTGQRSGFAIYAGIGLPLPVFDHGQGHVDHAKVEANQASTHLASVARSVELDVTRTASTLEARIDAWRRYQRESGSQVAELRAMADSSYREGKTGILELLDAYRSAVNAGNTELELRGAALSAALAFERALGKSK